MCFRNIKPCLLNINKLQTKQSSYSMEHSADLLRKSPFKFYSTNLEMYWDCKYFGFKSQIFKTNKF